MQSELLVSEYRPTLDNEEAITTKWFDLASVDKFQLTVRSNGALDILLEYRADSSQTAHSEAFEVTPNIFELSDSPKQKYLRVTVTNNTGSQEDEVSLELKANYGSSVGAQSTPLNSIIPALNAQALLSKAVLVDPETGENYTSSNPLPTSGGGSDLSTLEAINTDISNNTGLLASAVQTENSAVASALLQVGGRYDSTPRTLDNGDAGAIMIGDEGAVVTRQRCKTQTLPATISNNNRELPLSCTGDYISYVHFPYIYNDDTGNWKRFQTGENDKNNSLSVVVTSEQDPISVNSSDSLRLKRTEGKSFVASFAKNETAVSTVETLYIDNTAGTKTLYLYNIGVSVRNNLSSGNSIISLTYGTGLSGGSSVLPRNMKIGDATVPSASVVYNPTSITGQVTLETVAVLVNSSSTNLSSFYNLDYLEDFIELPVGYVLGVNYVLGGSGGGTWSVSFKYYEE